MSKKLTVENLGFGEIGGVGEMIYKAVHFSEYTVVEKNDIWWIMPEFPNWFEPTKTGTDYNLTGQELLVSLCNLYHEMNDPKNTANPYKSIISWCTGNVHPYDIDSLCNMAEETEPGTEMSYMLQIEGRFEKDTFIKDLCALGQTFDYFMAITEIEMSHNTKPARDLYYEGKFEDGYAFFERYRALEDEEYLSAVKEDLMEHRQRLIDLFPNFYMKLKLDKDSGNIQYGADVDSVFKIAWYTFSRMVADCAPPMDTDPRFMYSHGKIMSCEFCGAFYVRHSSRQKYCGSPDCEAERNRKNRRNCYARKQKLT